MYQLASLPRSVLSNGNQSRSPPWLAIFWGLLEPRFFQQRLKFLVVQILHFFVGHNQIPVDHWISVCLFLLPDHLLDSGMLASFAVLLLRNEYCQSHLCSDGGVVAVDVGHITQALESFQIFAQSDDVVMLTPGIRRCVPPRAVLLLLEESPD